MAIERLSAKPGKKGGAGKHARYITREGPYAKPDGDNERLYVGHGNLPVWCWDDPIGFFDASDTFERANGSTYKEWEIALPRELSDDQLRALINEFIEEQIGDRFAYLYAIHIPDASDGGKNPHCHLMFSERELDGIERSRELFFKRANTKNPERGGCKKANTGLKASERKELLIEVRHAWEVMCNKHLAAAGLDVRIDMRSYSDRGIDKIPEPKMRPGEAQGRGRAEVIDYFEAKRELQAARAEVERLIPDMGAEIISLREARELREAAAAPVVVDADEAALDAALAAAVSKAQQSGEQDIPQPQRPVIIESDDLDYEDDPLAQPASPPPQQRGPVLFNAESGEPYQAPNADQLAEWKRELDSRPEPTADELAELMSEGVAELLEELHESAPGEDEIDLDDLDALDGGPSGPNFG